MMCAPQDTSPFLLLCELYTIPRQPLIDSILDMLVPHDLTHLSNNIHIYHYDIYLIVKDYFSDLLFVLIATH